jgi:hypothetical protein
MTILVPVHHAADYYEVTVRGFTILRVNKYFGESQLSREVDFEELPYDVQVAILNKVVRVQEAHED